MDAANVVRASAIEIRTGTVRPIVTLWRNVPWSRTFLRLYTIDDSRRIPSHRHGLHKVCNADCHLTIQSRR